MSQTAVINKNKDIRLVNKESIKEEFKMSVLNMAMNIGVFNINISINKDHSRKNNVLSRIEYKQRVREAYEDKNDRAALFSICNNIR